MTRMVTSNLAGRSWRLHKNRLHHLGKFRRCWYLSYLRVDKALTSLSMRAVSPEPSLLAGTQRLEADKGSHTLCM